jgi:predicted aminopeptidase
VRIYTGANDLELVDERLAGGSGFLRPGRPVIVVRFARVLAVGLLALQAASCSPIFVLRAGYEEVKILSRRQPITRLVQDPRVPEEQREKLQLVLAVRDFAADSLELAVGDSYTTFSQLDSDTLALVLSAARRDRFEPHTWWFPIVGRVPYRAYFSERSAARAVESLERRGYDTYVRPTAAFSTLGWFNDPLVSPLLRYDSIGLANTVIHEVFHNTLFLPGRVMFNESLAQFVGARGSIAFFCGAQRDPRLCRIAEDAWRDELLFADFLSRLVEDLEGLYGRDDLTSEQKIVQREVLFERAQSTFATAVQPQLRVLSFGSFLRTPLNNASLIARRIYYRRLDLFEEVFHANGGDLLVTIRRIVEAAPGAGDPYDAVEALLPGERRAGSGEPAAAGGPP